MHHNFIESLRKTSQVFLLLTVSILTQQVSASPLQTSDSSVKAIIFDCDGVLVDTEFLKFQAWQQALAHHGVNLKLEDYLPWVGHSSSNIAKGFRAQKKIAFDEAAVIRERTTLYHQRQAQGVPPLEDAVHFLKEIIAKKTGYQLKIGLASSAPRREIEQNLKHIGISPKAFDAIVSGDDDLKDIIDPEGVNKPKPYIYQKIASLLNVEPKTCLVFEDTQAGVQAAASAGMRVLAVPNRFTIQQDFSGSVGKINFKDFSFQVFKEQFLMARYNIVLVPEDLSPFVNFSQSNFKKFVEADQKKDAVEKKENLYYLLSSESIPHISVCQFICEPNQSDLIIRDFIKWSKDKTVQPKLNNFNYTALSGNFAPRFAAELGVERSNELVALHKQAVQFIIDRGLEIKMSAFDHAENTRYRPHLTLAMFYPRKDYLLHSNFEQLLGNKTKFFLCIGKADQAWQLVEIIYK